MAFWIGYHGAFDLFTRGMHAQAESARKTGGFTREDERRKYDRDVAAGRMTQALRDLHLGMSFFDAPMHPWPLWAACSPGVGLTIEGSVDEISRELATNSGGGLPGVNIRALVGGLLISSYESVRHSWPLGKIPEYEFLRHSRNAAAHRYRFHLQPGEPKAPASWRTFTIDPSWHGQPLLQQGSAPSSGRLSPGDALQLLWDLEQLLPAGWVPS